MINLLEDANYFEYSNYSVPEEDAFDAVTDEELEETLREEQIKPASVVISQYRLLANLMTMSQSSDSEC